jgi:hypothetical protein
MIDKINALKQERVTLLEKFSEIDRERKIAEAIFRDIETAHREKLNEWHDEIFELSSRITKIDIELEKGKNVCKITGIA